MDIKKRGNKKSQVWVETVIYTLIGLTLLTVLLGFVTPKIKQMNDKMLIGQTLDYVLTPIDQLMVSPEFTPGNERLINLRVKKGELTIAGDVNSNYISFLLKESPYRASEPDVSIKQGNIYLFTKANNKKYDISLKLDHLNRFRITFQGQSMNKTLTASPTDYSVLIQNNGSNQINFELV